ncbi:hypothetical protein [Paraburkholderia sp. SG-MS1]|uniref:hypothetical protein n=1 Tax=Paraburkholderia sp. SG-MS1 TaxID=2023741 RepID=UPI0014474154|nr:hypothetical protein [Paraburkholderia sp. SG-MS1]
MAQQSLGELHSTFDRNMLDHDIGIDQTEHSVEIRQPIIGSPNSTFPMPSRLTFFAASSSMDAETSIPTALFYSPRQWHDQTTHATAEIRGPLGPKVPIQMSMNGIE